MLRQEFYQPFFDEYKELGPVKLGPYSSYDWRHDPRHILFTLARYKFCAKMLAGKGDILEVGCGDAIGVPILLQEVEYIYGVDFEAPTIDSNILLNEYPNRLDFEVLDITERPLERKFDAGLSLDVLEHIPKDKEENYMSNICLSLEPNAIFIFGTPNITSKEYASLQSAQGHVNLKSHTSLKALLDNYFQNVLLFSMSDEVVHTGFYPMAQYLFGVGIGVKGGDVNQTC